MLNPMASNLTIHQGTGRLVPPQISLAANLN